MTSTTHSDRSKPDPFRRPDEHEFSWALNFIKSADPVKWKYLAKQMNSLEDGTWFYLSMLRRLARAKRIMHNDASTSNQRRKRIPEPLERTTPFLNRRFSWD